MAFPIIPILKKIAVTLVTDKKARKVIIGIVLGIIVIIIMPIIAVLGIFSSGLEIGNEKINEIINEYQTVGETVMAEIEEKMIDEGYSKQKIEEAQAVYMLALFEKSEEENFVSRLVGCFAFEQTDEELVNNMNAEFGTDLLASEYTQAVQEIRDKYAEQEENTG